jgi:hypothetical protein
MIRTCSCALLLSLLSNTAMVLSVLQEANTVASLGLHCRSSTLLLWPL